MFITFRLIQTELSKFYPYLVQCRWIRYAYFSLRLMQIDQIRFFHDVLNYISFCFECFLSDEDLITPIFIPPTSKLPSPTTTPQLKEWPVEMKHNGETLCDDEEDCREGSGIEDGAFTSPPTSYHLPGKMESMSEESVERASPFTVQPLPFSSTYGHLETRGEIHSYDLTRTTPSVYQVPIPEVTRQDQDLQNPKEKPKSSADNTALVIGIIAGVLISIVFVALIVYKLRNRTDGTYKIDESKNYWFAPVSNSPALLGGQQGHTNSILKTAEKDRKLPKKENIKELKEWYV
ncbi:neurexin-3b-beta-like [Limulus polyphemus]|uniref:Neurexin-3b-beta-like n=1 Tax=Limulus polyphemus TaxID=6850 RepID=A0ABM1RZQ5_LIMPO|nr:neurexin-3b-beta-like [Limulus polyphemus]